MSRPIGSQQSAPSHPPVSANSLLGVLGLYGAIFVAFTAHAADDQFKAWTISAFASGASSAYAVDFDRDGDIDVLSSAWWADEIVWYENDGRRPPVFRLRNISTDIDQAESVHAADLDGDGDLDVVCPIFLEGEIKWYESRR